MSDCVRGEFQLSSHFLDPRKSDYLFKDLGEIGVLLVLTGTAQGDKEDSEGFGFDPSSGGKRTRHV